MKNNSINVLSSNFMIDKHPSKENWENLYKAAAEYFKLKPWEWMWDREIFGVMDPDSGELGYCCIMGKLGEHFALGLYRGARGLRGYFQTATPGKEFEDPAAVLRVQDCLMASFEDRKYLDQNDLQTINDLGLKFSGSHGWPQFRSFVPGGYPWVVTADEAIWLSHALEQAVQVAARVKNDPSLLESKDHSTLVRVAEKRDGKIVWHDKWMDPQSDDSFSVAVPLPDPKRIEKIKDKHFSVMGTWEADFEYQAEPVKGEGRPYFPMLFLIAHHETEMILGFSLAPQDDLAALQEVFLKAIEDNHAIPAHVWVRKPLVAEALAPIAEALGFDISSGNRLDAIAQVRRHMKQFFRAK